MRQCKERVWSSGDMDPCGEKLLPGHSMCIQHRVANLSRLSKEIKHTESELAKLKSEYDSLFAEGNS